MMFLRLVPLAVVVGGILFLSAGRFDIPSFWAYAVLIWLMSSAMYTLTARRDPALIRERMKPPSDRDHATRRLAAPLMVAHLVVAGADVGRFGFRHMPLMLQVVGFLLVAAGLALSGWTLLSNPFASSAVRIQEDRGQRVISTGPYAIVRHPMYFGVFLFCAGSGLALGSWWSMLVLVPILFVFVRRTLLEDRMLVEELPGYADYATRVRSRVLPGVF